MAITIHQVPSAYNQSDNPVIFVFSSDQTGQANFSYIVETFVNSSLVSTDRVFPQVGIYAKFDVSSILKWAVSAVTLEPIAPSTNAQNYVEFGIRIRENYGNQPSNQDSATSSTYKAWKSKLDFSEWAILNTANYVFSNGSKWLTNCPYISLRENETFQLMHIVNSAASSFGRVITYYDVDGNTVGSPHLITPTTFDIMKFDASYNYIAAQCTGNFNDVAYVTYQIGNTVPTASAIITIYIDRGCAFENTRLHWVNKLGGIDSFTFTRLARLINTTERESYKTQQGRLVGTAYHFDPNYVGQNDYQVRTQKQLQCSSGWLSVEVANWLNDELFDSPLVIMEKYDGNKYNYQRVALGNKSLTYSKQYTDTIVQVDCEVILANDKSMVV